MREPVIVSPSKQHENMSKEELQSIWRQVHTDLIQKAEEKQNEQIPHVMISRPSGTVLVQDQVKLITAQ